MTRTNEDNLTEACLVTSSSRSGLLTRSLCNHSHVIFATVQPDVIAALRHHQWPWSLKRGVLRGCDRENLIPCQIENLHLPVIAKTKSVGSRAEVGAVNRDWRIGDEKAFIFCAHVGSVSGRIDQTSD